MNEDSVQYLGKRIKVVIATSLILMVSLYGLGWYLLPTKYLTTILMTVGAFGIPIINLAQIQLKLLRRIDELELNQLGKSIKKSEEERGSVESR